ncbi:MAG: circularly permuted type 2 ATP-grasp protein [Acidobacteriota bacterium]
MLLSSYDADGFYDEMFDAEGGARPEARLLLETLGSLQEGQLQRCQQAAERLLIQLGITFNVYGDSAGTERTFPFDLIPRIIRADEWAWIERGLKQRIQALNEFINDIYHDQKILKDKIIPEEVIRSAIFYRPQCAGINPPRGVWCHITGTDLVRHGDGQIYVLEDNLRVPSGVSYVLENRDLMKRTFPQVFEGLQIQPVDEYPSNLLETLEAIAPPGTSGKPLVVLLTPGMYNSAYFEHSFLAQKMGIPLVEGRDLTVSSGAVWMRTTRGLRKVDVIYRRIDDDFLDPTSFRKDSMLGVPGIMDVFRSGNVALANAPGNGVADDKVVYAYVPDMIKYYMDQDPILPNVPTFLCWRDQDRQHVLQNLDKLVVKAANEAGGYGMLVGPHSTKQQREDFAAKIEANPRNYIAQPTLALSRVPTLVDDHLEGRHVDLRPYVLYGKDIQVIPGGLTRVALRKGSLVVNSSQGGGSKDTWVLAADAVSNSNPAGEMAS